MTFEPAAADQRRLTAVLLAAFDDNRAACDQAEADIEAHGGWKHAYACLAACYANLLTRAAGGEANARKMLEATLEALTPREDSSN